MEIYFGHQFENFGRNEFFEGLLTRAVKSEIITLAGAAYLRSLQ